MKKSRIKIVRIISICFFLVLWFCWDFTQAGKYLESAYKSYKFNSDYDLITSATTKVSIVRSNDDSLAHPVAVDDETIDYQTIEEMVRKAVKLAGGISWFIKSGDMVLLKPNIVDPEPPGSGEVTDVRVIKALIKMIDEIDPGNIEIVIGEGAPDEMDYELPYSSRSEPSWIELWDIAGYQDLLADPYLQGINFRLSNLNGSPEENPWQDLVLVDVPGGGEALPQGGKYWLHKDILNADVFITVPVMKIHSPGITVALKNQIGIAPSTKYGFYKSLGVPQDNYATKLTHKSNLPRYWTDKEIVDLCNLAQIKFVVVDAIACLETKKSATRSGNTIINLVRMNSIIAGTDPVAVDHVCTRLMGLNPDDIEHITLAEKVGLGTNNPEYIEVAGADLDQTRKRFKKSKYNEGRYGQGNRPYDASDVTEPIDHEFINGETSTTAEAGINGWSETVYFTDDRINLLDYYQLDSEEVVSYAFCYFDAPADQEAELWLGSDEAVKIYINGQVVYSYNGTRSFPDDELLSARITVDIKQGENTLLIKSYQRFSRYDFSLNICEPESNPDYDGNRIWGLKFKTESSVTSLKTDVIIPKLSYQIRNVYPNPFNNSVSIQYQLSESGPLSITIYNIRGQKVRTLVNNLNQHTGDYSTTWDGFDSQGFEVSSGLYLVSVEMNGKNPISRKILLVK
jgi:uncharacterized protein (DUF362 family)